jgi:hypothetical protein
VKTRSGKNQQTRNVPTDDQSIMPKHVRKSPNLANKPRGKLIILTCAGLVTICPASVGAFKLTT